VLVSLFALGEHRVESDHSPWQLVGS